MQPGGIATFGPGVNSGIGISGNLGPAATQVQGADNFAQNSAPTNNQYLLANNPAGGGGGAGTGGGGGTGAPNNLGSALAGSYDIMSNHYNNLLGQIDPMQQTDRANLDQSFNDQTGAANQSYNTGLQNHQLAQGTLDNSHTNSVRDLGAQLRGALAGYQNQLGTMGAGNSSAAPLIGYALSQQGTQQMGDLNNNYNQQQTGLNLAGQSLDQGYQANIKALNDWHTQNITSIANQYLAQRNSLNTALLQNGVSKAYALQANQALAQQTLAQLQQQEAGFGNGQDAIQKSYITSQGAAPADLTSLANGFNVQAQSNPGINGVNLGANQAQNNSTGAALPVSLNKAGNNLTMPS